MMETPSRFSPEKQALLEQRLKGEPHKLVTVSGIPKRPDRDFAPLSFAQRQIWVIDQMTPGNLAYNQPVGYRLRGPLDSTALEDSFNEVIKRHEGLRTTFAVKDGEPLQLIHPEFKIKINVTELDHLTSEEYENRLQALTSEESVTSFDLTRLPLIRVSLFKLHETEHVLIINLHHIVADGLSIGLMLGELDTFYRAFTRGSDLRPPAIAVQYADFALWQRQTMANESAYADQIEFWRKQLGGKLPVLELPRDRLRPALQSFKGSNVFFNIPKSLAQDLKLLGAREGCTFFMTILAAFQVILHRYSEAEDILIGTPIASRTPGEVEPLIGNFLNMAALRCDLSGNPTFIELLQRSRDRTLDAFSNSDLPFVAMVNHLKFDRDPSRNPLFQVMLQVLSTTAPKIGDLKIRSFHFDLKIAQFDLSLHLYEEAGGYLGRFEYCTDLFRAETVERLSSNFEQLLHAIVWNPQQRISKIPILAASERNQILNEWNDTQAEFPVDALLHELFEAQVERTPERTALRVGATALSYAELDTRAARMAQVLRSRGVSCGQRVGLCVERGADMLAAVLGILKAGAAYVPLDPALPQERLRFMAEDAQLALLVSTTALAEPFGLPRERQLLIDADAGSFASAPNTRLPVDAHSAQPEDPVYVIYTSGSTGKPKGVVVPHRAVVNFLTSMANEPGLAAEDVLVAVTTLSFDIAVLELQLPLTRGATVVIATRDEAADGRALRFLIDQHGATVMQATPATWRLLLEAGWSGKKGFKALVGGEAMPADLADQLIACGVELWNMYGPTETTVWSTCACITDTSNGITIGKPIANTTVYVLDAQKNLCPIGVPGELCIGGNGVALGYWNRPELTAERFIPDPFSTTPGGTLYRTGDRARWRNDGMLEHLGRLDFQVKIRGYRIELEEIEMRIAELDAIAQAVVKVIDVGGRGPQLVAYYVRAADVSETDIRTQLERSLPSYMIPHLYVELLEFPLTPNGKVNREALPQPEHIPSVAYMPPADLERIDDAERWWWCWRFTSVADLAPGEAQALKWLVFLDDAGVGQRLADVLRGRRQLVTCVSSADCFRREAEDELCLNPELGRGQYDQLVAALADDGRLPERVVHLWSVTSKDSFRPGSSLFHRNEEYGFQSVLWLWQALAGVRSSSPLKLFAVADSICSVANEPLRHPDKAMMLGVCAAVNRELPRHRAVCIDLELPSVLNGMSSIEPVVEHLTREVIGASTDGVVAYRAGVRYVRSLVRTTPSWSRALPTQGGYVLVGGLGRLGLALTRELTIRHGGRVVLIDRGTPPEGDVLVPLREGGSQVTVLTADAANPQQMRVAFAEARRVLGRIDGVFHLASNPRETRLLNLDEAAFGAVTAPRVHGLRVLAELLAGDPTTSFVVVATQLDGCTDAPGTLASSAADAHAHALCQALRGTAGPAFVAVGLGPTKHAPTAPSSNSHVARDVSYLAASGVDLADSCRILISAAGADEPSLLASSVELLRLRERIAVSADVDARNATGANFVAPRTALERRLAQLFCEVLAIDRVSIKKSFFELGGHSLLAVRLFGKFAEEFSLELPLAALLKAPSVEALARRIELERAGKGDVTTGPAFRYLVRLHAGTRPALPPLFVAAGAFGNVLNLRHLAVLCAGDRDFYGLQAKGLLGTDDPHGSIVEAADDYLEEIGRVQPHGPYLLGGFCSGGIIALEMARRLREQGEPVALVVMLDTINPTARLQPTLIDRLRIFREEARRGGWRYVRERTRQRYRWEWARLRAKLGVYAKLPNKNPTLYRFEVVFQATEAAMGRYTPRYYDGPVVLFRPPLDRRYELSRGQFVSEQRLLVLHDGDWTPWVRSLEIHEVAASRPGDHDGFVLEPYVRDLAARLCEHLARVEMDPENRTS